MFDIITFGSATIDIFLKPRTFKVLKDKDFITEKGICFPMGSKIEIDDILFATGGGGTNTATTFVKQGFKTAYCGSIGEDLNGQEVIKELTENGVDPQFVLKTNKKKTNYSIVLTPLASREDRTILAYRGASEILEEKNIPWDKLIAKWFYLAPLSGSLCSLFPKLIAFAKENNIKIAVNPGNSQLSMPKNKLKEILKNIDILILNQEEASFFTGIPFHKEGEIFKAIGRIYPGIVVMTKGPEGVFVSDGKNIYSVKAPNVKVVDRTGAGDAFGSGFVSGFIQNSGDIEYAIQLGVANATSCLQKLGAKNGLLEKGQDFLKVKIKKQ